MEENISTTNNENVLVLTDDVNKALEISHWLMSKYKFLTYEDTDEILFYVEGVYKIGAEAKIKKKIQEHMGKSSRTGFGKHLRTYLVNEILGHIRRTTYINRKEFNKDPYIINFKNGLYYIKTKEFKEHTKNHYSTIQIPVEYNPEAKCLKIEEFLKDVLVKDDYITFFKEWAGYCLIPNYRINKAVLLIGNGRNGKSTLVKFLTEFIGEDNCCSVSLHKLIEDAFAIALLHGKLVNNYSDISSRELHNTDIFKTLTDEKDGITANQKFKPLFKFHNFARLIFSCNNPPTVYDYSDAFFRRWIFLKLINTFEGEHDNKDIIDSLTTDEELSGFLNIALEHLVKVLEKMDFTYRFNIEENREYYLRISNPVHAFLEECFDKENEDDVWISKNEFYSYFLKFCEENEYNEIIGKKKVSRMMSNEGFFSEDKKEIEGMTVRIWKGIDLKEEYEEKWN